MKLYGAGDQNAIKGFESILPGSLTADDKDRLFAALKEGMTAGMNEDKVETLFNNFRIKMGG